MSLLLLGQRQPQPHERPKGQGRPADDGHAHHALPLHLLLDGRLQILGLAVPRLNLKQGPDVLEGGRVLLDLGVADGQVVEVVAFAALVTVLEEIKN